MRFATLARLVLSAGCLRLTGFVIGDEAEELKARARAVKSEAAQLLENGHKDEAEKLFQESKESWLALWSFPERRSRIMDQRIRILPI